jgi:alpha-1,6-mannosyltransferase
MITLIDCNNFWSPSGGGVRRYHLQKLEWFASRNDVFYVFVMHDSKTWTEVINDTTIIEHIKVFKIPGNWQYRFLTRAKPLKKIFEKYRPDVVETGSPYIMPWLVDRALRQCHLNSVHIGFWHADYPVTYIYRGVHKLFPSLATRAERLAWAYSRKTHGTMDGVFASSDSVIAGLVKNGHHALYKVPLGVDSELFNPNKFDAKKQAMLKAGCDERLTLFFPHRFSEEKGVRTLLKAYPLICKALKYPPAIVFVGTGPDLEKVEKAAQDYEHIHYLGFISDKQEMASWYASCELGLALSGWETFGLSIVEAMASGQALIGADRGAAREHILDSGCGLVIPPESPEALCSALLELSQTIRSIDYGVKARNYAQKLSWNNCFSLELKNYNDIIAKRNSL